MGRLLLRCALGTFLFAASSRASPHALDQLSGCGATVQMNPLKNLSLLQKVHHSWPIPARYLNSSAASFIDGLVHDYVRITGSCSLAIDGGLNQTLLATCVEICDAVAEARHSKKAAAPSIAINYSPWYTHFPGKDPTVAGAAEQPELAFYAKQLDNLKKWLPTVGSGKIKLGAVLIDSEKFRFTSNSSAAFKAALTRKHNLVWNATRERFPDCRIELYDRGAVEKWDTQPTWTVNNMYTLEEQGESLAVSLYTVPEIWNMRGRMTHTVALAQSPAGNRSGTTRSVTPWLSLGAGCECMTTQHAAAREAIRWHTTLAYYL